MDWNQVEAVGVWVAILITLGIAIVGWAHSNRDTQRANEHADEALELARSAEDRADRLERVQLESRDVRWEARPAKAGMVDIVNVGTDLAHAVTLVVDYPGQPRRTAQRAAVEPTEPITVDLTDLKEARRARARNAGAGMILSTSVSVRAHITWSSESGIPDSHTWESLSF